MKFNIANPLTGCMKCIDIDDEKRLATIYDKRIAQEIDGEVLGDEFKGYVFRIAGGNDKQGFPMVQGVLKAERVRLLLGAGSKGYRPRRDGERKRKSVRGCIVGPDISVLHLNLVSKGEADIPGLTDEASARPRRLGPKRANNIRRLFNLTEDDDVRKFVITREFTSKTGKTQKKRPKIQRLVTPERHARKAKFLKARLDARKKAREEAAGYKALLELRAADRRASAAARRSSRKSSRKA